MNFATSLLLIPLFAAVGFQAEAEVRLQKTASEFEVLKITGEDARLLGQVFGLYEKVSSAAEIIGIKSIICETDTLCEVTLSKADHFEADELIDNELVDLSPFNGLNSKIEFAFLSPRLEDAAQTEEMHLSSSKIFEIMQNKSVLKERVKTAQGSIESKILRGEKFQIRCFQEITRRNISSQIEKGKDPLRSYNCLFYAKVQR